MPLFNGFKTSLTTGARSGSSVTLFSATDSLAAGSNSIVLALTDMGPVSRQGITFQIGYATTPTAVVEIMGSNIPPTPAGPQSGVILYTSTNLQTDNYTDNLSFAFYWAQLISQSAGGALTLTAHVR